MLKKLVCIGMLIIMLFSLAACGHINARPDIILVELNEEYSERFLDDELKLEDFGFDNLKDFFCYSWSYNLDTISIVIELKKTGNWQANKAIKFFNKLEFVKKASFSYTPILRFSYDCVGIYFMDGILRQLEELGLDNAKELTFYEGQTPVYPSYNYLLILEKTGVRYVAEALAHLETLSFVSASAHFLS